MTEDRLTPAQLRARLHDAAIELRNAEGGEPGLRAMCVLRSLIDQIPDAAIAAAVREEREAAVKALEPLAKPAHTYASENADAYRGFDAGVQRCIERLRSRCEVKE